jgi:cytochrome c556
MARFLRGAVMLAAVTGLGLAQAGWMQTAGAQTAGAQMSTLKPEDVVQARQASMALTGGIADLMKAGVAAGADVKVYEEAAAGLVKLSKVYPQLFPENTQGVANTKAKAEIWSDRAGFEKAAAAFVTASTNLEAAAKSGDKAAFAAAFTAEGQSCGGCHRAYKAR